MVHGGDWRRYKQTALLHTPAYSVLNKVCSDEYGSYEKGWNLFEILLSSAHL